jgi:membrane-associated phospholipid phosphatase
MAWGAFAMFKSSLAICVAALFLPVASVLADDAPIEPSAGSWKTWVIPSGQAFRAPAPPDQDATKAELAKVRARVSSVDADMKRKIIFWDAGSPGYRWLDLVNDRVLYSEPPPSSQRLYAYLSLAIADAMIAAWDSKYAYGRPRPTELDASLVAILPTPRSPSYPSEHSAAAGAAAAVLAYFYPKEAATFEAMAQEAALSREYAGVQFPSDSAAGLELGRKVAERVIAVAKADGSDAVWSGSVPTGPCMWVGTKPGNATMPGWKPILLASVDEFRPPPPPDCRSDQMKAEVAAIKSYKRTFPTSARSYYWQSPAGTMSSWFDLESRWMFEDRTDQNAPRAARAYAMLAGAWYDAFLASNDGKYAYWYLRPHMLDKTIEPLFTVPNFPSYPSNHSTLSTARCEVMAYLFPTRAEFARRLGKEAGDSRVWAGIHYEIDNQAGVAVGRKVAAKYIERAKGDGAD